MSIPYNSDLPDCYIFDIDGTLAIMGDRGPYEWTRVEVDTPNLPVCMLWEPLRKSSDRIFIFSGRDSICRDQTERWLRLNNITYYDGLFMRPESDQRKDSIIKQELYEANIKDKYNVLGIFDDRNQVVDMWRSLGLPCFQVAYGDF